MYFTNPFKNQRKEKTANKTFYACNKLENKNKKYRSTSRD